MATIMVTMTMKKMMMMLIMLILIIICILRFLALNCLYYITSLFFCYEGEERPVDEQGQTSPQSSPDLGSLNEFHQLILLRLLRPDRFPAAASRYVQRHLTCVKPLPSAIGSILGSATRSLAVMVLMPPSPAGGNKRLPSELKSSTRPVDILQTYAQVGMQ